MWLKQAFVGLALVLVLVIEYNGNCTVNFTCNIEKIILTVCLMVFYTAINRERLLWGRVFPFKYNISGWNKTLFTRLVLKWLLLKRDLSNHDCLLQWRGREWNSHFEQSKVSFLVSLEGSVVLGRINWVLLISKVLLFQLQKSCTSCKFYEEKSVTE